MKILIAILFLCLSGCASIKELFSIDEKPVMKVDGEPVVKYSENPNLPPESAREYRHFTRQKMEEESQLQAGAGSMWVMEGQGAYLFAQNKARKEGDLLNVKLEGSGEKEVQTKVTVIKKLLKQLEEEEKRLRDQQNGPGAQPLADGAQPATGDRAPASTAAAPAPKKDEKEEEIKIDAVPTRIVERRPDGNYRIKGQSPFMIGTKEYKVIVTGIIRPEDFNDDGVNSGKLLDPQYDVVSLRRKE